MKKIFAFILLFCLVMTSLIFSASAEEYDYEQGQVIVKSLPSVWLIHFEPTDITGATAIQFDFFIDKASNFRISAIEFGSHWRNDWQELQYTGVSKWPSLKDGWNTVTLKLSDGSPSAAVDPGDGSTGAFNPQTFQRVRIFNTTSTDPQIMVALRNIQAVKEDGTKIPVGSANSGSSSDTVITDPPISDITVQPGSDTTSLNFNWISPYLPENPYVEIAPSAQDFESSKTRFEGTYDYANPIGISGSDLLFRYSCKVTVTGLKPGKSYRYCVGYDGRQAGPFIVSTSSDTTTSAYVLSDIHVIDHPSWADKLQVSVDNWEITLGQLLDRGDADLILSLGDQMQDTTNTAYLDGFFGASDLTDVVLAPINGNHDLSPASKNLPHYTNVPNEVFPGSQGISDYYFKSGNTLFIMLSITDINYKEEDHAKTFEQALADYPDYDWMVVCFHEAIYGNYLKGYTSDSGDALDYCNTFYKSFITLFDRYKPDLCLTGHSHIYGRSRFIRDGKIVDVERSDEGAYLNPQGTVYVNMGTSSRMWQFGNTSSNPNWPFSFMEFTCSDNGKAVFTYGLLRAEDGELTLEIYDNLHPDDLIDSLTIRKEIQRETPVEEPDRETEKESEPESVSPLPESETPPPTDETAPVSDEPKIGKSGCSSLLRPFGLLLPLALSGLGLLLLKKKGQKR